MTDETQGPQPPAGADSTPVSESAPAEPAVEQPPVETTPSSAAADSDDPGPIGTGWESRGRPRPSPGTTTGDDPGPIGTRAEKFEQPRGDAAEEHGGGEDHADR
jgi:hypothetical protein